MIPIHFFNEDHAFIPKQKNRIRNWIKHCIESHQFTLSGLNFIFCSDEFLFRMNGEYLSHDEYTDILTFDQRDQNDNEIEGDIFISVDRVKENAKRLAIPFQDELLRVMIHGVLHLLGYDDKNEIDRMEMRKKESMYLSLF
jgi:rRNA maturation RNase YbeY